MIIFQRHLQWNIRLAGAAALSAMTVLAPFPAQSAGAACSARSPATVVPVVELYTSEGCNSCPPADQWISKLKADPDIVALAFHVDYWDRLGWKDRFSNANFTQRQAEQQLSNGARFSYTPQVVLDGADRKDWPGLAAPLSTRSRAAATVGLELAREGDAFTATVAPAAGAPGRLAAYWAVTEQGHVTAVKAGENSGVTLKHDYVVREYQSVAAWSSAAAPTKLQFSPHGAADPAHPREVNLVVVNADTGRPVQAVKLGC